MKTQMLKTGKVTLALAIMLALVFTFITCELDFGDDKKVVEEYTDVVYSEDGTMVTLYLDGVGVPLSQGGRALNLDIAKMSYDLLEAVFIGPSGVVSRANWGVGRSAGIRGVERDVTYSGTTATPGAGLGSAILYVGISTDGTLLGIGDIGWVNNARPTTAPYQTGGQTITTTTQSVTFYVTALKTRLEASDIINVAGDDNTFWTSGTKVYATAETSFPDSDVTNTTTVVNSTNVDNIGVTYPIYTVPTNSYSYGAFYIDGDGAFDTGTGVNSHDVVMNRLLGSIMVEEGGKAEKRVPRYQYSGKYYTTRSEVYYKIGVEMLNNAGATAGVVFENPIHFQFSTTTVANGSGVFSFAFEIPVFAMTRTPSNADPTDTGYDWTIRSAYGENFYNLDDGEGAGGQILMGVNVSSTDYLDIFVKWRQDALPLP